MTSPASVGGPIATADHHSLEQAADWYVRLHADTAGSADWQQWRAWLDLSPRHQAAWGYIESVSKRFAPLRAGEPRAASAGLQAALAPPRRRHLRSLTLLSGGLLGGWLAWRHRPLREELLALAADHRSPVGQVRETRLADGSALWLNTASAVDFDGGPAERRLTLVRGEILVTAIAASRPFVVATPHGRLRTRVARFGVRLLEQATQLAVLDGTVEIHTANRGDTGVLSTGSQVTFNAAGIDRPAPLDPGTGAWTHGMIVASDMRLDALVAELARYRHGHLGVAPEVAGLRVMGTYPLIDTDRTLQLLARALSLRVERKLPWWTTLAPA
ncbi:Protein FecR [Achromobacter pulmonis]|uniref:FecR domain-containing protein n=1 Tax=Achromobacter pulmonis TaxID=1389932 RepID=UPI00146834CE|nr:FecR domain-containing protein [Achromobacter pulmonis]CAB3632966.1 Protein FecR [Achromobacter pulmonis]